MACDIVLILGSGPQAADCRDWPKASLGRIVAINNAWRVREDWDFAIHPEDFPTHRRPVTGPGQVLVGADNFVPVQNRFGGFVYAGGTMAFTAGYWALGALRPRVMGFFGCDMVYPKAGQTHFYGTGRADPLREDVTLRDLEAKSARLMLIAARAGCACVNLSQGPSRLVFPRAGVAELAGLVLAASDLTGMAAAEREEVRLGYHVPSGRYWEEESRFDPVAIDALDRLWRAAHARAVGGAFLAAE